MSAFQRSIRPRHGLAAALALLLVPAAGSAASLQVAPIRLEFAADQQSQALWLSNSGTTPLHAQVRVMRWTQDNGTERLEPTRDLVASPPLTEIAPGQKQTVRIVRLPGPVMAQEQAYRLIVDELPEDAGATGSGLNFLLDYSIPVFVEGPSVQPAKAPETTSSALTTHWQGGQLQVTNHGNRRVRLSQLTWANPDGTQLSLASGLLGYVLAGQTMHWPLTLPEKARSDGSLHAMLNDDSQAQALPLDAPVR